jgi:hypothetical protein
MLNLLDVQHHLMLLLLDGKLNVAPIENMEGGLNDVLDIATGTGNWAIDFGRGSWFSFLYFLPTISHTDQQCSKYPSIRERRRNRLKSHPADNVCSRTLN